MSGEMSSDIRQVTPSAWARVWSRVTSIVALATLLTVVAVAVPCRAQEQEAKPAVGTGLNAVFAKGFSAIPSGSFAMLGASASLGIDRSAGNGFNVGLEASFVHLTSSLFWAGGY